MPELVHLSHGFIQDGGNDPAMGVAGWSDIAARKLESSDETPAGFIQLKVQLQTLGIVGAAAKAMVPGNLVVPGFVPGMGGLRSLWHKWNQLWKDEQFTVPGSEINGQLFKQRLPRVHETVTWKSYSLPCLATLFFLGARQGTFFLVGKLPFSLHLSRWVAASDQIPVRLVSLCPR
jgi:hypothetical protein